MKNKKKIRNAFVSYVFFKKLGVPAKTNKKM